MDDDLGVFGQAFGLNFHFQQLRSTPDAAQGVFDLVRQIADQLFVGLGLVHQALFAVLLGLLLQWQQLDNDLAGNICLGHHHVHRKRLGVGAFEPGVIAQGRKLVAAGAFERVAQDVRLGKAFGQLRAFDVAARNA